jgi:tetratricopeptide (TPR) repeat protein
MLLKRLKEAQLDRPSVNLPTLLLIGLLMLGTGCNQSSAAKPAFSGPCVIALAAHQGDERLDGEIRQIQQHVRQAPNPRPNLEKLGWKFVEKARRSYDPGFYKLAEQCAACLETYPLLTAANAAPSATTQPRLKNADALLLRGHILHNLHRFQEAEIIARQLSTERGLAFDYALLGDVLLEEGRLDEAAVAYQKLMDLKPGLQAYIRAAQLRWLTGDLEGAIELALEAVRTSSPNEPEAAAWVATRLAMYDLQAGLLPQANDACAAALKVLPDYAPALLMRGRVWLAEGKTVAALASLQQAAKLNPLPEYQWTLAEALRAA